MRPLSLLLAAVALAGCGGDGERLTREEYVEQATAICARVEERVEALGEPQSPAEVETLGRELRDALGDGLDELRELEPPEELAEPFERYLEAGDDVVEQLDRLTAAAADGDRAGVERAAAAGDELGRQAAELAATAAIPGCEDD
jgi:hypothetical protein